MTITAAEIRNLFVIERHFETKHYPEARADRIAEHDTLLSYERLLTKRFLEKRDARLAPARNEHLVERRAGEVRIRCNDGRQLIGKPRPQEVRNCASACRAHETDLSRGRLPCNILFGFPFIT